MWIASVPDYIGRDLVVDLLTEHQEPCNSNEGVERVLTDGQ